MHVVIVNPSVIPAFKYGGTERVIWYLGKELVKKGHQVTFLVNAGSSCNFANVIPIDASRKIAEQIPGNADFVHFNITPDAPVSVPYLVTLHGNVNEQKQLDANTVFISKNHAERYGSSVFVHNGLDWNDYGIPDLNNTRKAFHFIGKAAWRVKNVKGAIRVIDLTNKERLMVLGGNRLNISMGFRFTTSLRTKFYGMVGGEEKNKLVNSSKGLIFPVLWHEPFGLALIESLYFGCPVFATPYGSVPEIVTKDYGFLSNNASSLAEAVENAENYSRRQCHEYAVEQFNSQKMAESYLKLYEKILDGEMLNSTAPMLKQPQLQKFLDWNP